MLTRVFSYVLEDPRPPHVFKREVEQALLCWLPLDEAATELVVYKGYRKVGANGESIMLWLVSAPEQGFVYQLTLIERVVANSLNGSQDSQAEHWRQRFLQRLPVRKDQQILPPDDLAPHRAAAVAAEIEAPIPDAELVAALQQGILDALQGGGCFASLGDGEEPYYSKSKRPEAWWTFVLGQIVYPERP